MSGRLRILHLEDSPADAELIAARLAADDLECEMTRVESREPFLTALGRGGFDLVLADFALPAFDGLTALGLVREHDPDLPVILLSGTLGEDTAVEALKNGAADYVLKDRMTRLGSAVRRALREADERRERARAERELQRSEAKYRGLFESILEGVFQWTSEGRMLTANPALLRMLGYASEEELLAVDAGSLFARPDDLEELKRLLAGGGRGHTFETELRRRDGDEVPVLIAARAVDGESARIVYEGTITDITEQKRYQEQLAHLAHHDALTGLYSRRRFVEELERQVANARRSKATGAVLWFGLDRFQEINDSFGHPAGDQVLVEFAGALRRCVRGSDVLARLGGDEFAVALPRIERGPAIALAERLQAVLRAQRVPVEGGGEARVTTSVGLAFFPEPCGSAQEVLADADLALYQAKEEGRDAVRVVQAGEQWRAELQDRIGWAGRLRDALEAADVAAALEFHAQPILDLKTREVTCFELLLRMRGDDGAPVLPGVFLPVAERFGMMGLVDRWVARRAIRLLAGLAGNGARPVLHVNLSASSLADGGLLERISDDLAASGVDPSLLVWEVTESAAIADLHRASEFARRLRTLGCRLALDDFGIGFASLSHLKHLPVDFLKIDGSFVRHLTTDPVDQHLVQAIAQIARGLHKRTIAEFVETAATLELLAGYGIDSAQGFHIGRPGPLDQVLGAGRSPSPGPGPAPAGTG